MPKRGGQHASGSRFATLQSDFYDDNDREHRKERGTVRRVSFKNTQNNQFKDRQGHLAELAMRSFRSLQDDEDMGDLASLVLNTHFDERTGTRRKGSPIPKGKFGNFKKVLTNPFGWYQVTVHNGQRYSKDDVLRALLGALAPDAFIAHYWRTEKNCVVFFVDDFNVAQRLQQIERGMQMPDGQRIFLRTRSNCPLVPVDEDFKEKMKLAMADRYNPHTKTLDISRFHADPKFKNMFVGLFRYPVMSAALDIIVQNIPDLVGLYMNDNGLVGMEGFKNIPQRLPHLTIIHLGNNKIPSLAHLLGLRNVPIVDLVLEGNPLRNRYKDKAHYISEVRRKFPKLQKLDGELLEPQIRFDLTEQTSLPEPKASYLCDNNAAGIIREFLETYFKIFDSDNRSPLMAAYHPNAMMSIIVPPAQQAGRLNKFWNYNRNIRRIEHYNANEELIKYRLLKVGNLPIVAVLTELPKTQHDLQSFSVDLTLFVDGKMMIFTVGGLFKEFDSSAPNSSGEIRYFRREFVVVPNGPGSFCIRNEMFFVTSATHPQVRSFMRNGSSSSGNANAGTSNGPSTSASALSGASGSIQNRLQVGSSSTAIQIQPSMLQATAVAMPPHTPAVMPTPAPTQIDDNMKLQMVQALSVQTTMNVDWSRKCLEETNWDFSHAAFVFDKLHKENKIPAEAFIK